MSRKQKKALGYGMLTVLIGGIFIALGLGFSWQASGIVFLTALGVVAFYGIIVIGINLIVDN